MNNDDIKYFNVAGKQCLENLFGDEGATNFFVSRSGSYNPFPDEMIATDGSEGETYIIEFYVHLNADVIWDDADADFFGTEMIRKHSPFYASRCHCDHDCCGHEYTSSIDIYHRHSVAQSIPDAVKIYKFVCFVYNGRNL